jgi:competence protein ComEA
MPGLEFSRNQKLALCVLIGLSAIGLSFSHVRNALRGSGEVVLREPGQPGSPGAIASDSDRPPASDVPPDAGKVVFQVAGCVKCPGVYSLADGKRVADALKAAGGSKPNADPQAINLAARIEDGARIYVPAKGENSAGVRISFAPGALSGSSSRAHGRSSPAAASGKLRVPGEGTVSINMADSVELQRLPGVGPATAQKILDYRGQIGRFTSVEQLMDVKGIGPAKLDKIRPFVVL